MSASVSPSSDFQKAVKQLLRDLGQTLPSGWESMQMVREIRASASSPALVLLEEAMTQLEARRPYQAQLLHQRYWQDEAIQTLMRKYHRSKSSIHRDLRAAHDALAAILWEREQRARERFAREQYQRLEAPTYDRLFGVDALLTQLRELILSEDGPALILLTGMGGMGKTSVADRLSRLLIDERAFAGFGWISLRPQVSLWDTRPYFQPHPQQEAATMVFEALTIQLLGEGAIPSPFSLTDLLARLRTHLHHAPHFIVIDNLESLPDIRPILTQINNLARPTRFLITSRRRPFDIPDLHVQSIPSLHREAARALLRHEARKRNILALQLAPDEQLDRIWQQVGGNPLALRLVAGQLHVHPLPDVLAHLTQGRQMHQFFDYIYRQAWASLDDLAQRVLIAMSLLPPHGGDVAQIAAITELSPGSIRDALETLIQVNLVDVRVGPEGARYTIHSLTRAFLHHIAAWS